VLTAEDRTVGQELLIELRPLISTAEMVGVPKLLPALELDLRGLDDKGHPRLQGGLVKGCEQGIERHNTGDFSATDLIASHARTRSGGDEAFKEGVVPGVWPDLVSGGSPIGVRREQGEPQEADAMRARASEAEEILVPLQGAVDVQETGGVVSSRLLKVGGGRACTAAPHSLRDGVNEIGGEVSGCAG
jgi:hypothetical protein